jgi:hypothetical protein
MTFAADHVTFVAQEKRSFSILTSTPFSFRFFDDIELNVVWFQSHFKCFNNASLRVGIKGFKIPWCGESISHELAIVKDVIFHP